MRSPKHKLTGSGKGWYKRIGSDVKWICSFKAAPTAADADRVYEEKFAELVAPPRAAADDPLNVEDLGNAFLANKRSAVEVGNLDFRTADDYGDSIQIFKDRVGGDAVAEDLEPVDFARFLGAIAHYSVHRRAKHIVNVRSMFNWALAMRYIGRLPDYGPEFSPPSRAEFRKARAKRRAEMGQMAYTPDEVKELIAYPHTTRMRVMMLLALNGGFGNTDLAELRRSMIHLKRDKAGNVTDGWIDYARPKTGIERKVPLWPETIALLEQIKPVDGAKTDHVFVTRQGRPLIEGTKDALSLNMMKICKALGITSRGFYSLRRTFRTIADERGDTRAIARIMGHEIGDMADIYVQDITPERLRAIVDHVRERLQIPIAVSLGSQQDVAARRKRSEKAKAVWLKRRARPSRARGRSKASRAVSAGGR